MKFKHCLAMAVMGLSSSVFADNVFTFANVFDSNELDVSEIRFEVPVGTFDMRPSEDDNLSVNVEIEGEDCQGNGQLEPEVKAKLKGDVLRFEIEADDCKSHLEILMPTEYAVRLEMGVGEIDVEAVNEFDVELGVGSVSIEIDSALYSRVEAEAGVGEADIDLVGGRITESERWFINKSVTWRGEGDHRIEVEVGVGEVHVHEL